MGSFYSGFGGHKSNLGYCEDGVIYSGRTPIGGYENGNIYNQFKEKVGSYSSGSIYDAFGTHVASYDGGSVYNKYLNAVVGKEQVGSYDSDPAEAAALVLLFLGGNNINSNSNPSSDENNHTSSRTTTYSSSSSSDTGFLSEIFGLVVIIIGAILKILPYIWWGSMTALVPLVMVAGPFVLILAIISVLCHIAFYPYCIMLILYRIKKQISTKTMFIHLGKWFKKGPFAYKDIIALKDSV